MLVQEKDKIDYSKTENWKPWSWTTLQNMSEAILHYYSFKTSPESCLRPEWEINHVIVGDIDKPICTATTIML